MKTLTWIPLRNLTSSVMHEPKRRALETSSLSHSFSLSLSGIFRKTHPVPFTITLLLNHGHMLWIGLYSSLPVIRSQLQKICDTVLCFQLFFSHFGFPALSFSSLSLCLPLSVQEVKNTSSTIWIRSSPFSASLVLSSFSSSCPPFLLSFCFQLLD